ncbi:HD domain-containing protein [Parendozoicomonas haliclonae]|uniref:HD domain protein n=1 Tax=Parendozoicomonas haliclonae TaxID=1960125 RepID=A0A1X7AGE4_9GAMM|nr:HD domain-containing protein [Parendozoicomonas haliclonae]SMA37998.1 HD domain protein [Parendozoicomonas haliclonae]
MESKRAIARIIDLYRHHGAESYGEDISQLDHALQAADLAIAEGRDNEVVAAAFLHDVGHLLEIEGAAPMGDYGTMAHDLLGADYLRSLGFPERVATLVASHVQAKRYLCAMEPGYYDQLSEASKETLHWQGGVMSTDEVSEFSCRKDLDDVIALRRYDEAAKKQEQATEGLRSIEAVLQSVLEREIEVA